MLFNNIPNVQNKMILCNVSSDNISIGTKRMIKVYVDNDEYYISYNDVEKYGDISSFYYLCTRKDLI